RESNNSLLEAMLLDLPSHLEGTVNADDTDVFSVQNFVAMGSNTALEVRWANVEHPRALDVELLDTNGTTLLGAGSGVSGRLNSPPGLNVGNYFVRLRQPLGRSDRTDLYRLWVRKVTVGE